MNISSKTSGDSDKEDIMVPDTALNGGLHCPSPPGKDRFLNDNHLDFSDSELPRTVPRSSSSGNKESSDSRSPMSKECWSGKLSKAGDIHLTTTKLRHIHKCAKVDTVSNKKLEQWNEMLRTDAIKLCQDNNFMTGFFEGTDTNYVVDAYELKIRLEHILERISLISDAADTEKPSPLTNYLSIGFRHRSSDSVSTAVLSDFLTLVQAILHPFSRLSYMSDVVADCVILLSD
ncbi:dual specificity protein phosphatase PHS1-like isoform X2 [Euphorbia lathyris]|uniref:dual specificity protein phosphatase PHS1-like isoform X2 n=1 Tax=Euphorbia lathyris TaxID=212925 RepID=UPI0033135536